MKLFRLVMRQSARRIAATAPPTFETEKAAQSYVDMLPQKEFEALALHCGKRLAREHPIDVERLMEKADKNSDGVIDISEFTSFWRRQGPRMLVHAAAAEATPPTSLQLQRLAIISALPCIIFGFLDNSIMLVAGDAIDATVGLHFGLSAMACAAFGNVIADVTGQLSGGTVDALLRPYLPNPRLTLKQQASGRVRATHTLSSTMGIFVGCVAGCAPLLFLGSGSATSSGVAHEARIKENGGTQGQHP